MNPVNNNPLSIEAEALVGHQTQLCHTKLYIHLFTIYLERKISYAAYYHI